MPYSASVARILAGTLCAVLTSIATAALAPRDLNHDGVVDAYFDNVLNITWLRDANLLAHNTFGLEYGENLGAHSNDSWIWFDQNYIHSNGQATWGGALHWIDAMNAASYLGFGDWRLPAIVDTGAPGAQCGYGGTDCGWNVQTVDGTTAPPTMFSELAFMYSNNLDNIAAYSEDGAYMDDSGLFDDPSNPNDENLFLGIQGGNYWSGTEYDSGFWLDPKSAWTFSMRDGSQGYLEKVYTRNYVWVVRTGDVSPVPEPSGIAMLVAGLCLLAWRSGECWRGVPHA